MASPSVDNALLQMASLSMGMVFAGMAVVRATRVAVEAEGEYEASVQPTSRANSHACQEAKGLLEAVV